MKRPSKLGTETCNPGELLLRERVLFVTGTIDPRLSESLIASLLYFDREDPEQDIYMIVNSHGGYVIPGLAIVDVMHLVRARIWTVCIGWAMSMGAVLLSSGTKGCRVALPNAQIMVHQPSGSMSGTAADMKIENAETERLHSIINNLLAANTGQPIEKISADTDRNFYMTAEDAKAYGLIDDVVTALPGKTYAPLA